MRGPAANRSRITPSCAANSSTGSVAHEIPGTLTFDRYFACVEVLNHILARRDRYSDSRAYVGDLKFNRKLESKGRIINAEELAATITSEYKHEVRHGEKRQ